MAPRQALAAQAADREPPADGSAGRRWSQVLTPQYLAKLDRLRLAVRRALGTRPGQTPMPHSSQGTGIELESYRTYTPGDDLRHLDWNAYGRLDQLLIKAFRAEREAPLHVFIDCSASMGFPPADDKLGIAAALAASLAYVSVSNHDPARIVALSSRLPLAHSASPFCRHRQALQRLAEFMTTLRPDGETSLARGVAQALQAQSGAGLAVVLSDFLTAELDYERALGELLARGYTVSAVRLLGPGERQPETLFRRGRIVDAESGAQRFVTLGAGNVERYRAALAEHLESLRRFCSRAGVAFAVVDTAADLEEGLFGQLPAAGLVRT
jgi:uncharacterized protein (DUF58 family)